MKVRSTPRKKLLLSLTAICLAGGLFYYVGTLGGSEPPNTADGEPANHRKSDCRAGNQAESVHFSPVWFPDGTYKAYAEALDAWTPAGMLQINLTDDLTIRGSAFDDWRIKPVK